MARQIRIGTSGWNYPHWAELFYPGDIPKARWLEYYSTQFDTVELNATFYRLPRPATFENWRKRTPEGFLWSVKASRYITHVQRLKDVAESLERLYSNLELLGDKLGVVLIQLPPSLKFEMDLVSEFCRLLRPGIRHTIEARNQSWCEDEALDLLRARNIAWCISDTAGRYPCLEALTADFAYIRLHGPTRLYASEYTENDLQNWAQKVHSWDMDTYIYFDNDFSGYAVKNARRLKEILLND